MLDLISDILFRLSLKGTLYFRTSFTPPFGVTVPRYQDVARFHFAHRGECVVRLEGSGTLVRLAQGDLILIPHGASHSLLSSEREAGSAIALESVLEDAGYGGEGVLVHGGGDDLRETQLICGHFSFLAGTKHPLLQGLPEYILLRNYGEDAGQWLAATLRIIGAEAGMHRPGGDLIALKMAETVLAQVLRASVEAAGPFAPHRSGLADARIMRAVQAVHGEPARRWKVEDLAGAAGLSRSAFAKLFAAAMGMTPMEYVTSWRMQIARHALAELNVTVAEAAHVAGYASEAAFSRVFKRAIGAPPSAFRQRR